MKKYLRAIYVALLFDHAESNLDFLHTGNPPRIAACCVTLMGLPIKTAQDWDFLPPQILFFTSYQGQRNDTHG